MSEREMLEMAAKAGGLIVRRNTEVVDSDDRFIGLRVREDVKGAYRTWNSLTNSGDALPLAVDLRISLHHFRDSCAAASGARFYTELHNGNPHAAACRAITRAAADIGRMMA